MKPYTFNMCGAVPTPAVIAGMLQKAGLTWEMHNAQFLSLQIMAMNASFEETSVVETEDSEVLEIMSKPLAFTLGGIPVKTREDIPRNVITLVCGDKMVGLIEGLAIPCVHGNYDEAEERKICETFYSKL